MKQKRILDSVHGNIYISENYFKLLIDTPEFQRLRRIEQTSIRSIFPCARHDRFIHSIGVYHIGRLFTNQLHADAILYDWYGLTETKYRQIIESYHIACLLHDIAHAPFSHTFESYYGRITTLKEQLKKSFGDIFPITADDFEYEANFHEYASAILVLQKFREQINELGADEELIVRMIIGCTFKLDQNPLTQIKNCFINLLNGGIVDADRLDYACRDVWASGYSASKIDVSRLISGLHIAKNDQEKFEICYSNNIVNEIQSVIDIKDFQTKYVIHHHTVVYEQQLLIRAAEYMALELVPENEYKDYDDNDKGNIALQYIISLASVINSADFSRPILKNAIGISYITDDDLVFLMKHTENNIWYKEWESRQYKRFALWKTPSEFYYHYPTVVNKTIRKKYTDCKNMLEDALAEDFGSDAIVLQEKYKPRLSMKKLRVLIDTKVLDYDTINTDDKVDIDATEMPFFYVYIPYTDQPKDKIKPEIIKKLEPVILSMYEEDNNAPEDKEE